MSIIRKQVHFRLFIIILSSAALSNHEILNNSAEFVSVIVNNVLCLSQYLDYLQITVIYRIFFSI